MGLAEAASCSLEELDIPASGWSRLGNAWMHRMVFEMDFASMANMSKFQMVGTKYLKSLIA